MTATPLTRKDGRLFIYNRGHGAGFASSATSIDKSPPAIHDAEMFQNSAWGPDQLSERILYRPGQSTTDRLNFTGEISGDAILLTGADYLDDTDPDYEFCGLVHPDELNECVREAVRIAVFPERTPLTIWDDGDCSSSGVASWSVASATASRTKITSDFDSGFRSLQVTTTSANGYVQNGPKRVTPGEPFYHAAIGYVNGEGTLVYQLIDYDTGTVLFEGTSTRRSWVHFHATTTIPLTTDRVAIRVGSRETTTITVWDCFPAHELWDKRPNGPDWCDERWKLVEVETAHYSRQLDANTDQASSRYLERWKLNERALEAGVGYDTTGHRLLLLKNPTLPLPENDIWVYGSRRGSDRGELDDESAVTYLPEDLLIPAIELKLAEVCLGKYPEEKATWQALWDKSNLAVLAQRITRLPDEPEGAVEPENNMTTWGGRGG